MKFATVVHQGQERVVAVNEEEGVVSIVALANGGPLDSLQQLIQAGYNPDGYIIDEGKIPFDEVEFKAPIPRPHRNVICVGKNYHAHAHEFTKSGFDSSASNAADAIPSAPIIFTKFPESVVGPYDNVKYPHTASNQLDYEAELGVIIGEGGSNISKEDALKHVFGYTIINDVTARDLQIKHKQWFLGKSLDTFCPMGPWIATADEVDLGTTQLRCWVNGELRQDACTADLIFDVPTLIETISRGIALKPGDIIATGTPVGVGIGFSPPIFLQVGDEVVIEIDKLGRMANKIA